jgi:hypothetical protein
MPISNNMILYQLYLFIHNKLYQMSAWNSFSGGKAPEREANLTHFHLLPSLRIGEIVLTLSHLCSCCSAQEEAVLPMFAVLNY